MLMALLIALGTMQLAWMAILAVLILLEKAAPFGEQLAKVTGAVLLVLGVALLVRPEFVLAEWTYSTRAVFLPTPTTTPNAFFSTTSSSRQLTNVGGCMSSAQWVS
jgi:hypothetical protein